MGDKVDKEEQLRAKGYLPAPEVIKDLGVHHTTLYRWIKKKKVKSARVGGRLYVSRASLVEYLGQEAAEVFGYA